MDLFFLCSTCVRGAHSCVIELNTRREIPYLSVPSYYSLFIYRLSGGGHTLLIKWGRERVSVALTEYKGRTLENQLSMRRIIRILPGWGRVNFTETSWQIIAGPWLRNYRTYQIQLVNFVKTVNTMKDLSAIDNAKTVSLLVYMAEVQVSLVSSFVSLSLL